jgi:BioD-like phosphotransacetylase family protein
MKPLYIGATLKDCGKTSVSLGLMQMLKARGLDPGYCKPVGQHYVRYHEKNIDEDGVLFHQVFDLKDEPYYLSPIAIERGFTRKFINNPDVAPMEKEIVRCHQELLKKHPMVIIEGTGHAGVGSCFGLSNARVAELLDAKVVIVTSGGIGRPIDEIALSLALFADHDVEVIGVILNKVLPEKYDAIKETVGKGLKLIGTRLIGALPCGADALSNVIEDTVIAAMAPQNVLQRINTNTLVITPGDRIDNILVSLLVLSKDTTNGGLILTGGFEPHPMIEPLLKSSGIPVLMSNESTFKVSARMKDLGFKIRSRDTAKVQRLRQLVEENVDTQVIQDALNS